MFEKYKNKIIAGLFFIWGIFIVVYYFYNYPDYGDAFISVISFFIVVILLIINIIVLFKIVLVLFWPKKKIKDFLLVEVKKTSKKINDLKIPLYFFPLFLYFFAVLWIMWIYFNSSYDIIILGNNIIILFLVSWLFLISFSLGSKFLKIFKYKTEFFLEKFLFSCALGFGILMFIMYFLGIFSLYYTWIAYLLAVLITVLTLKEIEELWVFLRNRKNYFDLKSLGLFEKVLLFLTPIILGIYIAGIFQQYPIGFDAFISYLTYPKTYAENHGIVNFPFWIYFGFPQNGEMLFTLGFLLFNFQVVLGIIYIFTILIVLAIYYFFKKNNYRGKFYAIIIYLSLPIISFQNLEEHKIEMIFIFYTILGYILFINYLKSKKRKDLIIFGIFCGIAAGLKYFFLTWYIIPLAIFFLIQVFRKKIKLKYFFVWGLIIFMLMLPWFIKNIKFSGNPIDPILSEKLASKQFFYNSLGQDSQQYIVHEMRNEAYLLWDNEAEKGIDFFLRHLFIVTFLGNKKYTSDCLEIGFLFVLFIPILFFHLLKYLLECAKNIFINNFKAGIKSNQYNKIIVFLCLSLILLYFGWIFIGYSIIWYAVMIYIILSILISYLFLTKNRYLKLFYCLFLSFWLLTMINYQFSKRIMHFPFYSRDSVTLDNLYLISQFINNNLENNQIVWGIDVARNYYINNVNNRYISDGYSLAFSYLFKNRDEEEILKFLKDSKIKYFLWAGYSENITDKMLWTQLPNGSKEYANFTLDNYKRVIKFKNKHMELIAHEGDYYLYKLKEE